MEYSFAVSKSLRAALVAVNIRGKAAVEQPINTSIDFHHVVCEKRVM